MEKKTFVVVLASDERTRWLETDERIGEILAILARSLGQSATAGAEPTVTVTILNSAVAQGKAQT